MPRRRAWSQDQPGRRRRRYEPNKAVDETLKMIELGEWCSRCSGTWHADRHTPSFRSSTEWMSRWSVCSRAQCRCARRSPGRSSNVRASYDDEAEALVTPLHGQGRKVGRGVLSGRVLVLAVFCPAQKSAQQAQHERACQRATFQAQHVLPSTAGLAAMLEAQARRSREWWARTRRSPRFIKEARTAGLKSQLATVSFVGRPDIGAEVGQGWRRRVVISQVVPFPEDNDLPIPA